MSSAKALFNPTNIQSVLVPSAAGDALVGYYHFSFTHTIRLSLPSKLNFTSSTASSTSTVCEIEMSALFIGHKGSSYTSAISGFDHEAQPGLWVMVQSFFLGKYLHHDLDDGIVGFVVLDGEGSNGTSASSVFNPTATVPSRASRMGVSMMCGPALIVQLWTVWAL